MKLQFVSIDQYTKTIIKKQVIECSDLTEGLVVFNEVPKTDLFTFKSYILGIKQANKIHQNDHGWVVDEEEQVTVVTKVD